MRVLGSNPSERLMTILMVAIIALPSVVWTLVHRESAPWKASYFAGPVFSGTPVVRRQFLPDRSGDDMPPLPFSTEETICIRWETILESEPGGKAAIMMTGNGAFRILIDGHPILEDLGDPARERRTRGARVRLSTANTRITVEQTLRGGPPFLVLAASLDGRAPKVLSSGILSYPN